MLEFTSLRRGTRTAIYKGMTIRVGTIQEMSGQGFEYLVDEQTRSLVLAKFFDGQLITAATEAQSAPAFSSDEATVAAAVN